MQKAINIVAEQIKFLAEHTGLGIDENMIRKILEFKMPSFEEVQAYVDEHCPKLTGGPSFDEDGGIENFIKIRAVNKIRSNLKHTYHYYKWTIVRPQRILIRCLCVCLALHGRINLDTNPQVIQDLKELDINLEDPQSVQSGCQHINKYFQDIFNMFVVSRSKATDLSNYINKPMDDTDDDDVFWIMRYSGNDKCFEDETLFPFEIFGKQQLKNFNKIMESWAQKSPFNS